MVTATMTWPMRGEMPDEEKKEKPAPKPAAPAAKAPPSAPFVEITSDPIIDKVRRQCPDAVLEAIESYGMQTLRIARDRIVSVCEFLRDDSHAQFDFLTDLTARHIADAEKPFQVIYHLYSFPRNVRMRLKVALDDGQSCPSVVSVWSSANWMEREAYDLVGVRFEGHPDLRRLLLPEDWEGHPLRKDYPLEFRYNRWTQEHLNMIEFREGTEYTGRFE
jgi:NADH-quinone oxidoreductase subunit C